MVALINMPQFQASPLLDLTPIAAALRERQRQAEVEQARALQERKFLEEQRQFNSTFGLQQNADQRAAAMHPVQIDSMRANIGQSNASAAASRGAEARAAALHPGALEAQRQNLEAASIGQLDPEKITYRRKKDGSVEFLEPPTGAGPSKGTLDREAEFRKEFNSIQTVKEFQTVRDAYANVKQTGSNPSAAGDLSMIFAFMKILDPNSVVREQEFANAQNAAGVPDRIRNVYNRVLSGERLNENQRLDFMGQAEKIYQGRERQYVDLEKQYRDLAGKSRARPEQSVVRHGMIQEPAPQPATAPAAPAQQAAPSPAEMRRSVTPEQAAAAKAEAAAAIRAGADRMQVIKRLRDNGINPSGL